MEIKINISSDEQILVKKGQQVDFRTSFTKKTTKTNIKIPLASELNIKPEKIFLHLIKVVGEEIKKGELIATKKTFFGEKKYHSDYDGIIKEIHHDDGSLTIAVKSDEEKIRNAYFKGKISDVKKQEVVFEVEEAKSFPLKATVSNFGGEVLIADQKALPSLTLDEVSKKVVFMREIQSYNQVKLEAMDVSGFVTIYSLPQKTQTTNAQIKNAKDFEEIKKLKLPYCLVDKKENIIYLYQ